MSLKKWLNDHNLLISVIGVSSLTALLYMNSAALQRINVPHFTLESEAQDWVAGWGRPATPDPQLVFLADDAASHELDQLWDEDFVASPVLKKMKKRIWTRDIWAAVLSRLADAGAKVVAFDYMFKGEDDGDAELRAAVEKHANVVVLGSHFSDTGVANNPMPTIEPPAKSILGEAMDPRVGYVNMFADLDGILRKMRYRLTLEEFANTPVTPDSKRYEALAARMAEKAGLGDRVPAGDGYHRFRYAFKGETLLASQRLNSLYSIFVPSMWEANYQNGEFFRDKIVLIGPEGNYTKDVVESPFGRIAGPEAHLNAINALLTRELLRETPRWFDLVLIFGCGALAWLIGHFIRNSLIRLALLPVLAFGALTAAIAAFNVGWVAPLFSPLLALVGSTVTAIAWQQIIDLLEKARLRRTFERYVSRDVVKELLDNPSSYLNSMLGQRKRVTILFSDVRGFTTITESGDAQVLVKQLNEYFEHMVDIVFANRGTLDKFIGDAVMAQWGGIVSGGEKADAIAAVRTAVQMRKRLAELNAQWIPRGMIELRFGIGVNHGEAIVGNLGCEAKMEVSLIGDAVNTASRLEGITKEYHTDLLVGESVQKLVRDTFQLRTVGLNQPKGKTVPLELFGVIDERDLLDEPQWLRDHEEGVRLYRTREFSAAAACFEKVLATLPEDWLANEYLEECREFIVNPPPEDWNAVHVMKSK